MVEMLQTNHFVGKVDFIATGLLDCFDRYNCELAVTRSKVSQLRFFTHSERVHLTNLIKKNRIKLSKSMRYTLPSQPEKEFCLYYLILFFSDYIFQYPCTF